MALHGNSTKLFNDLLSAVDPGEVSALCLLDLTVAFKAVDHDLLLKRLECIVSKTLHWLWSYLPDRSFHVVCYSKVSSKVKLVCSVMQGSVLGPLLFLLYMAELEDLATSLGVPLHAAC